MLAATRIYPTAGSREPPEARPNLLRRGSPEENNLLLSDKSSQPTIDMRECPSIRARQRNLAILQSIS